MKFSSVIFVVLSSVLVFSPAEVLAAPGRPRRLDVQVDQRDLDAFNSIDIDTRDMPIVPRRRTMIRTRGLFSKDKIALDDIEVNCPYQECVGKTDKIKKAAQKKYNNDKNLNKGNWAKINVEVKIGPAPATTVTMTARLFATKTSNLHGGSVIWRFVSMKDV